MLTCSGDEDRVTSCIVQAINLYLGIFDQLDQVSMPHLPALILHSPLLPDDADPAPGGVIADDLQTEEKIFSKREIRTNN